MTALARRGVLWSVVVALLIAGAVAGLAADKTAKKAAPAGDMPADLPPPELSVGGRMGDGFAEGFGDIVAPVLLLRSGIVFVNPRATLSDNSTEEYNLGVGYRHLLSDRNIILGANVFYDYRETELGGTFNQLGLGLEYLSEWVDARANVYLPEDERDTVGQWDTVTEARWTSTSIDWDRPYAAGHSIIQKGTRTTRTTVETTRQHFEQYEQAMEGWDAELGVKLPIPVLDDFLDLKIFGGYYSFSADYADDIEGFKGRLEVRALPSVYLDAEVYEDDELNGSDYVVGVRVNVPFEVEKISEGKSPFQGAGEGFKTARKEAAFVSRLAEMVIRDPQVRTEVSDVVEDMSLRQVTRDEDVDRERVKDHLMSDVAFVDGDNAADPGQDGTWEHPFDLVTEGINAPGNAVYVSDAAGAYPENVALTVGMTLWGSGCPVQGHDGKDFFGSGIYPTLDGVAAGPTITLLGDGVTVGGMRIAHSGPAGGGFVDPLLGVDYSRGGIYGFNVTDIDVLCNRIEPGSGVSFGTMLTRNLGGDFAVRILNNTFGGVSARGVTVSAVPLLGGGDFFASLSGNYSGNGSDGAGIWGQNYQQVDIVAQNVTANANALSGLSLAAMAFGDIRVTLKNAIATGNVGGGGISIMATSFGDDVSIAVDPIVVTGNGGAGLAISGSAFDDAQLSVQDVNAGGNLGVGGYGVAATMTALNGGLGASFDNIFASGNAQGGMNVVLTSSAGLLAAFEDISTSGNLGPLLGVGLNVVLTSINGGLSASFERINSSGNARGGVSVVGTGADDVSVGFAAAQANGNLGGPVGHGVNAVLTSINGAVGLGFEGIGANGNAGGGINLVSTASQGMSARFADIQANGNLGAAGRGVGAILSSINGGVGLTFDRIGASGNAGGGINVIATSAQGMSARFADIQANGSGAGGFGVSANLTSINGGLGATFANIGASGNGQGGLSANLTGMGNVSADFQNIQANGNLGVGSGFGVNALLTSINGGVGASFGSIGASGNAQGGVTANLSGSGNVSARFEGISANGNLGAASGTGVNALLTSINGGVVARFEGITASGNAQAGVNANVTAFRNVSAVFAGISANGNLGAALGFGIMANLNSIAGEVGARFAAIGASGNAQGGVSGNLTGFGDVAATFEDITANANTGLGAGYGVNAMLNSVAGEAGAVFDTIAASGNAQGGVNANLTGFGDVSAVFADISASGNTGLALGFGVNANLNSVNGRAVARFEDVTANANAQGGINAGLTGFRDVYAAFVGIAASGNTGLALGYGVNANLNSASGRATARFDTIAASGNAQAGINANLTGFGDVAATFEDITANANTGLGAGYGVNAMLNSVAGEARAEFDTIAASGNAQAGVNANLTGFGDVSAVFADISASGNTGLALGFGVNANLNSVNGRAVARFEDVTANANAQGGINAGLTGFRDVYAAFVGIAAGGNTGLALGYGVNANLNSVSGRATARFAAITANGNAQAGINANLTGLGDVSATFEDITANANTGVVIGYGVNANLNSINGEAGARFDTITASGNAQSGINVNLAGFDDVAVWFEDVTANGNTGIAIGYGVNASLNSISGRAIARFEGITANANARGGINANVTGLQDAWALFAGVTANGNVTGPGIAANLNSTGDDALALVSGSQASGNGNDGIQLVASALDDATVGISRTAARNNTVDGIDITATSGGGQVVVDLGGGGLGGAGLNSIYGNAAFGVNNLGGSTASVEHNFWGGAAPVGALIPPADYQTPGGASPGADWLAADPLP